MNKHNMRYSLIVGSIALAGCVTQVGAADDLTAKSDPATVATIIKQSFAERGQAKLDRLNQSEEQAFCSEAARTGKMDPVKKAALEKAALEAVKYPADGQYLGDWKNGMKLAEKGRGMQFSDKPGSQVFGNCYACHQLDTAEISFGNMGPSLNNYGKLRGNSEEILKYTWARVWNSHAFNACNAMPRFGAAGLLTEAEIKDVMALLLDPQSPVNK
ncbi:MAG: sulfur oxidation c-type cytochrome SoxX [Burkholderiaceae bacterium]